MTKPKPIKSHNPKDVEFYIRGWNEGQAELETAVLKWMGSFPVEEQAAMQDLFQSLKSAMEHS